MNYLCDMCSHQFEKESELTTHIYQHVWSHLVCKFCNRYFDTKEEYDRHTQRCSTSRLYNFGLIKNDTNGSSIIMCHICTESFSTGSELQLHSFLHPPGRTLKCRFCGIAQNKQVDVTVHETSCVKNEYRRKSADNRCNNVGTGRKVATPIVTLDKENNHQDNVIGVKQGTKFQKLVPKLKCLHCDHQCNTHSQAVIHFLRLHYTMTTNIDERPKSGRWVRSLPPDRLVRCRDSLSFYCDLCGHKEGLLSDLTAHIADHIKIPFFCELCKSGFSTKEGYRWHMRTHRENRFCCRRCGDVFETVMELESHRVVKHAKGNRHRSKVSLYPCHKCGKFIAKENLRHHMKLAHTEGKKEDSEYVCEVCGAKYLTKSYFVNHMREHKGLKRLTCMTCNQVFLSEENLENHKRIHPAGPRPYKCRYCEATYTKQKHRKRHENVKHIRDYSKKCPECGKLFLDSERLKVHSVVHTKEKKFVCTVCQMRFTQCSALARHKRIHTKDKKHECSECGMKFVQKYSLTRHTLVHTGAKPHKCSLCAQAFRQVFMLTQHVKKHHSIAEKTT